MPHGMQSVAKQEATVGPIRFGFSCVDNHVALLPGSLHLVASRPGVGKTTFALNISLQMVMAPQSSTVAYFTFKHPSSVFRQQCLRILRATKIRPLASGTLQDFPIGFFQAGSLADIRNMLLFSRPRLIVIDELDGFWAMHKLNASKRTSSRPAVLRILKELAEEFGATCLVHANVNRAAERRLDQRPRANDVSGGKRVFSKADNILILHRDSCSLGLAAPDNQELEIAIYAAKGGFDEPFRFNFYCDMAAGRLTEIS